MDEVGRPMEILALLQSYDVEHFVWIQVERDQNNGEALRSV